MRRKEPEGGGFEEDTVRVDNIVGCVGYRPDLTLTEELQVAKHIASSPKLGQLQMPVDLTENGDWDRCTTAMLRRDR